MAELRECVLSMGNLMDEIQQFQVTDVESDINALERMGRMLEEQCVILTTFLLVVVLAMPPAQGQATQRHQAVSTNEVLLIT